jgi:hypothetical protein
VYSTGSPQCFWNKRAWITGRAVQLPQETTMRLDYSDVSLRQVSTGKGLGPVASMRVMMIMRERQKALTQSYSPERMLKKKKKLEAYRFIDLLGIRRPQLISGTATHDTLPAVLDHCVIKPVNGKSSNGVYAVFNENVIQKIKTAEVFSGRETLIERLKEDLLSGTAKEDRWIIEELIVEDDNPLTAARDINFYCFYGRVAHVMEVIRDPDSRYCFWDRDCKHIEVGGLFVDDLFVGRGFTPDMLKTAERISAEIPTPFLRIDFHYTGSELVFCEFTPTSGGIWSYGRETDQFLGECYLDAEARLLDDLLKGKNFDVYDSFYTDFQREQQRVSDQKRAVLLSRCAFGISARGLLAGLLNASARTGKWNRVSDVSVQYRVLEEEG